MGFEEGREEMRLRLPTCPTHARVIGKALGARRPWLGHGREENNPGGVCNLTSAFRAVTCGVVSSGASFQTLRLLAHQLIRLRSQKILPLTT